jgi:hypothetical protein
MLTSLKNLIGGRKTNTYFCSLSNV